LDLVDPTAASHINLAATKSLAVAEAADKRKRDKYDEARQAKFFPW